MPANSVPSATVLSECPLNEGHAGWLNCPVHAKAIEAALAAIGAQSKMCRHVHGDGRICGQAPNECVHPENLGYAAYIDRERVRLDPHTPCREREQRLTSFVEAVASDCCMPSYDGKGLCTTSCAHAMARKLLAKLLAAKELEERTCS